MIDCPVCHHGKWSEIYKINLWAIKECAECGFARIDPMPVQESRPAFFTNENIVKRAVKKHTWPQKFSRFMKRASNKVLRRGKSEIFYKALSAHLLPGSKILDIGCGDGSFLALAGKKFICSGIEISDHLAGLAKAREGLMIKTGNFLEADFAGEKYDGITLISLLEHLTDPLRALQKCYDLLSERGMLLIKTVNYECGNRRIKKGNWTGFRPPDHAVYFSPSNLKRILKSIGFKEIKTSSWIFNDNMYCLALKK
jgi:2-polyprenyl-3-methyl-5-hydroxy-6-metoxy-1,4-benzoquinol methylase